MCLSISSCTYIEGKNSHDGSFYFKFIIISARHLQLSDRPSLSLFEFYNTSLSLTFQASAIISQFLPIVSCHHVDYIRTDRRMFSLCLPNVNLLCLTPIQPLQCPPLPRDSPMPMVHHWAFLLTNSFPIPSFLSLKTDKQKHSDDKKSLIRYHISLHTVYKIIFQKSY